MHIIKPYVSKTITIYPNNVILISTIIKINFTRRFQMEYENENENKLGSGIITICILHFIANIFAILSSLLAPSLITPELASQYGFTEESVTASIIPTIIISIVYIVGCILILAKQKIGVFIYFFAVLANAIITIALNGFSTTSMGSLIASLILPVLMGIFISKKKELYGFDTK